MPGPVYQFGEFRLDAARFELWRDGQSVRMERKPLELLILLAGSEGRLVTRGELAQSLWNKEVFVDTEHGINTAIRKIRVALGDHPDDPHFLQTVTAMGYRFIAPVTILEPAPALDELVPPASVTSGENGAPAASVEFVPARTRRPPWLGLALTAALAVFILIFAIGRQRSGAAGAPCA